MTDAGGADGFARITSFVWPVKESFRQYVLGSAGTVAVVDPARPAEGGFAFPRRARPTGEAVVGFSGGLVFRAHSGLLSLTLAEPAVMRDDSGFALTVSDPERPTDDSQRWLLARLEEIGDGAGGPAVRRFVPRLTVVGSEMFGSVYPPGSELDVLELLADRVER